MDRYTRNIQALPDPTTGRRLVQSFNAAVNAHEKFTLAYRDWTNGELSKADMEAAREASDTAFKNFHQWAIRCLNFNIEIYNSADEDGSCPDPRHPLMLAKNVDYKSVTLLTFIEEVEMLVKQLWPDRYEASLEASLANE